MKRDELLEMAREAMGRSYSPYSGFAVGAAVLCKDGSVYSGANIENVAGTSCCAERVAIFKAVSEGKLDFLEIAVVCDGNKLLVPCGFCLQTIAEFCEDIFIHTPEESYRLRELLPMRFRY